MRATSLNKGENVSLSKSEPELKKILIGLGWEARATDGVDFDLDASAFLLGANSKIRSDDDFIFYNNLKSKDGSVEHTGDHKTRNGDDEAIRMVLGAVPNDVQSVAITVTIHDAEARKQSFGQVKNAFIRIVNDETHKEIARYNLSEDYSTETAMVFGEIYRHNEDWKFRAVGQGYTGGLAAMWGQYGRGDTIFIPAGPPADLVSIEIGDGSYEREYTIPPPPIGRNPEKAQTLEGILQLPIPLWPEEMLLRMESLKAHVAEKNQLMMAFGELCGRLGATEILSREKVLAMARALEGFHLGMEPDVLAGARTPKPEDKIALFAAPPEEGEARNTSAYKAAALTLDLSQALALADGEVSEHELAYLERQINSWAHLTEFHRNRLKTRLSLNIDSPPTLASFKKKLDLLPDEAKKSIGLFLAHLAQADGVIASGEVKFLEKLYKILGLPEQLLYSTLHGAPVSLTEPSSPGLGLDEARIARLRKETEAVSLLLGRIFAEEEGNRDEAEPEQSPSDSGILPSEQLAFVRHLISQPSWSRSALDNLAADMELMLDGTLEQINEKMFDMFDMPLTEGDDPIEINPEVMEKLSL